MQEDIDDVRIPGKNYSRAVQAYPESTKLEAVKLWMVIGNLRQVAAAMDLNFTTVRTWRYSEWWENMVQEIRSEDHIKLSNKLKKVAQKAIEVMGDRLENGDYIYDQKTGSIIRKEVNLRDATLAFNSIHDRELKLEAKPQDEAQQKAIVDRLAALASKFEEIANKRVVQVTDVIYKENQ